MHGEYKHMIHHKNIAVGMGIPEDNIFILENGRVLEFDNGAVVNTEETVPAGNILVDGLGRRCW